MEVTRPEISGTSSLSVRGRTVPSLMTDISTSDSSTTWTRTPGGSIGGDWISATGRLRTIVMAASAAMPSNASGSRPFSILMSMRMASFRCR